MWQTITQELGLTIPLLMILLSLAVPAAAAFFYWRRIRPARFWQAELAQRIEKLANLKGNSIIHLQEIRRILPATGDNLLRPRLEMLIDDSKNLYDGKWIPDPAGRIQPEHLRSPGWQQLARRLYSAALLAGGLVLTGVYLIMIWTLQPRLLIDLPLLRLIILLPLILGVFTAFIIGQSITVVNSALHENWRELIMQFNRKFPVYSQEHETATLIHGFHDYDRQMSQSVAQLTEQISLFSSQQLTDAITQSVKTVMERNLTQPLADSFDKLETIADNLSRQVAVNEKQLAELAVASRQELQVLYNELAGRQQEFFSIQAASQQDFYTSQATGQKDLYKHQTTSQQAFYDQQNEQLSSLLDQLTTSQQQQAQLWIERYQELSDQLTDNFTKHQTAIRELEQQSLEQLTAAQSETLQQLRQDQTKAWQALADLQNDAQQRTGDLLTRSMEEISQLQSTLARQQEVSWQTALTTLQETEGKTLELLDQRQQNGVDQMLQQVTQTIAAALSDELSPVSAKLTEAAKLLQFADQYANQVSEALSRQSSQNQQLQQQTAEVLGELSQRQQSFTDNVQSLQQSTQSMSGIAEQLNGIFTGSQQELRTTVDTFKDNLADLSGRMQEVIEATATQHQQMMTLSDQSSEVNQKQIDAVRGQIDHLSDELSNRIDQLLIGFSRMTEDMLEQVDKTVQNQNDSLGGSLRALTSTMEEEARGMSLYSQQISMDIGNLNDTLKDSVGSFDQEVRQELDQILNQFDSRIADILSRLTYTASELGDAVEALPKALGQINAK